MPDIKVYFDIWILYLIHKTGVKNLCTAWNFFKDNVFVLSNSFFDWGDRLENFFLKSVALNAYIRGTYAKSAYTKVTYFGAICSKNACIGANTCSADAWIEDTGIVSAKGIQTKNSCFAKSACFKSAGIGDICSSAHKSSEFFIKYLRLIAKLIFAIPIRSCLYLQIILNKIFYFRSTYWICLIVYLLFQLAWTNFNIVVEWVLPRLILWSNQYLGG